MDEYPKLRGTRSDPREGYSTRAVAAVAVAVLSSVVGCGMAPENGDDGGRVHFNPLERDARAVREIETPSPPVSVEDNERMRRIISGFRENAQEVFRRDDPNRPLGEIERLFQSTGKYLQLVGIYQEVVDEQGIESGAAPRLAWVLVRLGQERQARELLDRLLEAQSDNAFVHFVDGSYWFNRVRQSREAAARAAVAWRRVVELEPEFQGPRGLNARAVRRKVRQIEQRLPQSPEQMLAAAEQEGGGEPGGSGEPPERGTQPEEGEESTDDEPESETSPGRSRPTGEAGAPTAESRDAGRADPDGGAAETDAEGAGTSAPAVPVLVTRADLALGRGDVAKARRLYRTILEERASDHLGATFGMIRVRYQEDGASAELADQLRELLDRSDLEAELAYEMGLFARAKLDDSDLAGEFWDRVRELDPDYAESVGLED